MSYTTDPPRTIITLKSGGRIFVTETPAAVKLLVNKTAAERLMTVTRWSPLGLSEFSTRPDNVVNVEANV